MIMLSKQLAYGLALAAGLAMTSAARANDNDVIRLALPGSSGDVLTLGGTNADLNADTLDVARYGGYGGYRGGYYGGYRGGYGGYRGGYYGGYRGGYYGGYRGGYYGGYRGGYYGGYRGYSSYYRPYYGGYYNYYRPYYSGYYQPYYYSTYSYYSYSPSYYGYSSYYPSYSDYGDSSYYGTSDDSGADTYAICVRRQPATVYYYAPPQSSYQQPSYGYSYSYPQQQQQQPPPSYQQAPSQAPQLMPKADETFEYDGGPKNPVPMPSQKPDEDAKPTVIPFHKLQPGETLVSVKPKQSEEKKTGKWNYPAYGEKPTRGDK